MKNILMNTIEDVSSFIENREISPVELTDYCLLQIEKHNPELNAYVFVAAEEAKLAAKTAEKEIMSGTYRGKLHGIPIAYKDLYFTKGMPTTACSKVLKDFVPQYDSTVVERLKNAGAINLGKTNTTEFAFGPTNEESYFGPARNPWNSKKIPGGSSGGSAIATASGMAYLAMGSDSGGSIRIPAAMCGVVGFKPSIGLISTYGILPLSFSVDTAGPICRSVADVAIVLDSVTGTDSKDPSPFAVKGKPTEFYQDIKNVENLKGKTLGVPTNFFFDKTDYEVERLFYEAVDRLKILGAEIREVHIPGLDLIPNISTNLMFSEGAWAHRNWFPAMKADYQKDIPPRLELGLSVTATEYIEAVKAREEIIAQWASVLEDIDAVITPTCPIEPFDIGLGAPWNITTRGKTEPGKIMATYHTRYANMTGAPALSVPTGLTKNGLPVGLMIMGKRGYDVGVLEIGMAYERHYQYPVPPL